MVGVCDAPPVYLTHFPTPLAAHREPRAASVALGCLIVDVSQGSESLQDAPGQPKRVVLDRCHAAERRDGIEPETKSCAIRAC